MRKDVPLKDYSTMRLGGSAKFLCNIKSKDELVNALEWAENKKLPTIMIGGGSNIIWADKGFDGLVMVNQIKGYASTRIDSESYYVDIGAGEEWDYIVKRTVNAGLSGIESLSLIPGTAGATPIQNVGAYGQEISDSLVSVEAYDSKIKQFVTILADQCKFGYRNSRFKSTDRGRFFISSLKLELSTETPKPPFYDALQKYLDHLKIKKYDAQTIREVVIAIRSSKIPDPKKVANNGSFFANPIITKTEYNKLKKAFDDIPGWPHENEVKVPAAWLLENAGYKNFHDKKTGMATWHKQPLVLVNEKATTTGELLAFRNRILKDVDIKFGIKLRQEPEILPY